MTQRNKELILADLCARVPYHPKGHVVNACNGAECDEWLTCATFQMFTNITNNCRLYLRPMSSMTEEEEKEFKKIVYDSMNVDDISASVYVADWLYSKHLDAHGLIPKGLAIEVTEENNPYKK